jgi:molybdate transport system substrate-binding protein
MDNEKKRCRSLTVRVLLRGMAALCLPAAIGADTLTVAVAANFQNTMKSIVSLFEQSTPHTVVPVFGSSGALYTQIKNSAPFDLFLSADEERPLRCIADGVTVDSQPITYALGKLALWSPRAKDGSVARSVLDQSTIVAIAEPAVAPYGAAAVEALHAMGRYDAVAGKLAFGRDIGQAYQFIATGNAAAGFVALSQIIQTPAVKRGWYWIVPDSLYRPIRQCAVILKQCRSPKAARELCEVLTGKTALEVIRTAGYGTAGAEP